jgi:hypothetical protein
MRPMHVLRCYPRKVYGIGVCALWLIRRVGEMSFLPDFVRKERRDSKEI